MNIVPLVQFSLNLPEALHLSRVLERDPRGTQHPSLQFVREALSKGINSVVASVGVAFLALDADDVEVQLVLPEEGIRALTGLVGARTPGLDVKQGLYPDDNQALYNTLVMVLLDIRSFGAKPLPAELIEIAEELDVDAVALAQAFGENAAAVLDARRKERALCVEELIAQGILPPFTDDDDE